jgi:hypothetical protein
MWSQNIYDENFVINYLCAVGVTYFWQISLANGKTVVSFEKI